MMKGSLSWQLHLVRTYLATISTRCSSPPLCLHLIASLLRGGLEYLVETLARWVLTKWSCNASFHHFMSIGATEKSLHWINTYNINNRNDNHNRGGVRWVYGKHYLEDKLATLVIRLNSTYVHVHLYSRTGFNCRNLLLWIASFSYMYTVH